jgi:hypothetical protein
MVSNSGHLVNSIDRMKTSFIVPHPLSAFFNFSRFNCFISCKYTNYINYILLASPSPFLYYPSLNRTSSCTSLFMCSLSYKTDFPIVFFTCIYCSLIRLTPSTTLSFLFPYLLTYYYYSKLFSAFHYDIMHRHNVISHYPLSIILLSSHVFH